MLATVAWVALILGYMKILLDRTGDPIYPVHWNLLANIFGRWNLSNAATPGQLAVKRRSSAKKDCWRWCRA